MDYTREYLSKVRLYSNLYLKCYASTILSEGQECWSDGAGYKHEFRGYFD